MPVKIDEGKVMCPKCGTTYPRYKGFFPVSYAASYKGLGHIPICSGCIESIYNSYLEQCGKPEDAVRQTCRKLDLYWGVEVFSAVAQRSTAKTIMSKYITKLNTGAYIGMSYDDTLTHEGALWSFAGGLQEQGKEPEPTKEGAVPEASDAKDDDLSDIPDEVIALWGTGYSSDMYKELEQRREYWMSKLPDGFVLDIGTEAIIKQMCSLELDINRDRAAGRPVDKSINALNSLLGSANLKPVQKKQEDAEASIVNTPMGVWLQRYETKRPLPDHYEDSSLLKYVFTWMGHVLKMLGVKNKYEQMYQDEIDRLRVEKPEYDGDDDEVIMTDYMNGKFTLSDSPVDEEDEQDE